MRNWVIVGLILFVIGLIGAGGTLAYNGDFSFGTEKVEKQQSIAADGIRNIDVKTGSVDLTIVPGEGNEVKASLTGRASKKYLNKLDIILKKDGDTLKVSFKEHFGFQFGLNIMNVDLKLEVPQQQYGKLKLDSGSGDNAIAALKTDTLELDGGSGDVDINGLRSGSITVTIGSGNIALHDVTAEDNVMLKAGSGDMSAQGLTAKRLDVAVSSGDVELADAEAELSVKTGSGDISVEGKKLDHPASLKTGSGDVEIMTDEQPEDVEITHDSGSGNLDNDWDGAKSSTDDDDVRHLLFGSGSVHIDVHTGSGDLDVGNR
ncbi:DUF4097 family beta strand repeat-containing protein [Paenibacillus sacheonensis]|uniref:DUF4097 family beta strand repeat protein n=1 Tax=Paenibacillus sacheonensis TaxID=742054 RepID=A0A7X5C4R4_9BACL|nr:DUF4097 family beta strand repeat-containing protein [Paenibacillus sacheonensis]MBM7568978.1 DUF4097 and DUF4098 domain-containing protein YvlB [Paenibacillus sacheonensis]NBC72649.1 DUF4097 family beta strand repeat protein [Paenibacillus sacheonensis]